MPLGSIFLSSRLFAFSLRLKGLQIVLKPLSPLAECDLCERIKLSSDEVFINHFAMISKEKLLPRNSFRHVCTHAKLSQKTLSTLNAALFKMGRLCRLLRRFYKFPYTFRIASAYIAHLQPFSLFFNRTLRLTSPQLLIRHPSWQERRNPQAARIQTRAVANPRQRMAPMRMGRKRGESTSSYGFPQRPNLFSSSLS